MSDKKKRAAKKVTIDYKNGKIYKVVNDVNDVMYVGSTTTTLSRRFSSHKQRAKTAATTFYTAICELGVDHFRIILVENYPCGSKAALEAREYEVTNAVDKQKLYNSKFDGKPTALQLQKSKEANFTRGCITHFEFPYSKGFQFGWLENGVRCNKKFSYGTKRTRTEAYLECVSLRDRTFPLTNKNLLDELPFME